MTAYRVKIESDQSPLNPRKDYDNVGTMVCWHRRYDLGDEQPSCGPDEYRYQMAGEHDEIVQYIDDAGYWRDPESITMTDVREFFRALVRNTRMHYYKREQFFRVDWPMYRRLQVALRDVQDLGEYAQSVLDEHYVILPLYLYDHSGITISTGAFSCPWDSGQVGFIYVTRAKALEEWGGPRTAEDGTEDEFWAKRLTQEVKTYDQYLTGDVYGFVVERLAQVQTETRYNADGSIAFSREVEDWEDVDSCWGFFGDDPKTNGMAEHVDDALHDALVKASSSIDEWQYVGAEAGGDEDE